MPLILILILILDGRGAVRKNQEHDHDQEQEMDQSSGMIGTVSPLRKVSLGGIRSKAFARLNP